MPVDGPTAPPSDAEQTHAAEQTDDKASFAETALKLGGKSEEEARRTGAIDKADDQVEALFSPQYQTVNSPAHRAIWDRGLPVELFGSSDEATPSDVARMRRPRRPSPGSRAPS